MKAVLFSLACMGLLATSAAARPTERPDVAPPETIVDIIGDVTGNAPAPHKAAADTTWIATWNFEGCDDSGWVRSDNRILNDGNIYWQVNTNYDGWGNIDQEAAVLTSIDPCTFCPLGGYSNDWYQGIRLRYVGDSYLSFDYLVDSEGGYDFLQVESDSVCSSFSRVDYDVDPEGNAAAFRNLLWSVTGFDTVTAHVDSLLLSGYASADTHCAYITFYSDGAYSCSDGLWFSLLGAGAVVDNILIDGVYPLSETFSGFTPSADIDFVNMQDSTPFGVWARVFQHISDNDLCTENPTCAWLSTDDTTPTLANDPSMAFGPGGFVLKNWLDEVVVGPWVSLASTASAFETIVQFRRFPGNFFGDARFVQNWSVRGRTRIANPDTPAPGDSIDCISGWGHASQWNSLSIFAWITNTWNATTNFDENSRDIQLRLRISDWQWIAGASHSSTFRPGPGPFWDRVRIGRRILSGPVFDEGIDARCQAQDAAPNDPAHESGPLYAQAAGGDIFGTTAFSRSADLATGAQSANLVVGDSITVNVEDVLGNGGLVVEWYAAIVAGPHAGKSPAPYPVGPNGFFAVPADSCRGWNGAIVQDRYFVDLDDTYFRGGDAVRYFWWATDAQGGAGSLPEGLSALPAGVHDAESATGGLFEVNFLPSIEWDAAYLARIAADAHGDLDPTPTELATSDQFHCILYYENVNSRRRSGELNRTSFMYTLDKLGYRGQYDVYDHMGLGNTNNPLGARMSPEQARNYSLLIYDAGNRGAGAPILPDGVDIDAEKIDMSTWFRNWCALSGAPNAEHTLWILGSNVLQEKPADPLFASMAVTLAAQGQGQDPNPDVFGVANFSNHTACVQTHVGDQFALNGGCPVFRNYDDIRPSGTGVQTHVYGKGSPSAAGAIVMHANAGGYTTILSSFPWFDIAAGTTQNPTLADETLLSTILSCAIPIGCQWAPNPTDVDTDPPRIAAPAHTVLRPNTPNPFNPVTTMHFDLAQEGHVSLKIYDVAGRLVRTLKDETLPAGFDHQASWNGLDDNGKRVGSGIYFSRLVAGEVTATRKLVVMK